MISKSKESKPARSLDTPADSVTAFFLAAPGISKKTVAWCSGSVGMSACNSFLGMLLLYYYNQVLGLSAILASAAIAVSVAFDALSDPAVAYFSDRFSHRLGRRIPFMLLAVMPCCLLIILLFSLRLATSQLALFLQMTALVTLFRLFQTLYAVPRQALALELFREYDERNFIFSRSRLMAVAGEAWGVGGVLLFFLSDWNDANGYVDASLWIAAFIFLFCGISSWQLRKVETEFELGPTEQKSFSASSFLLEAKKLIKNPSWQSLLLASILFSFNAGIDSGTGIYFDSYLWQWDPMDKFFAGFITVAGAVIGAFLATPLLSRFAKKRLAILTCIFALVTAPIPLTLFIIEANTGLNILPPSGQGALSGLWWIYSLFGFVQAISWGIFFICVTSMFADVNEEHQVSAGNQSEGLVMAADNLLGKLTANVGILLGGVILTWAGFDIAETVFEKEAAAINLATASVLSTVVCISCAIISLSNYRITRESHNKNLTALGFSKK